MQVNSDQWYVRWFLWNCRIMDQWMNHGHPSRRVEQAMSRGTNLCTFFRTMLLGTVVVLLNLAVWAWVAFVMLVAPFLLFNMTTVAMSVGLFVVAVLAAMLLAAAVVGAPDAIRWVARKTSNAVKEAPQHAPTFLQVFGRYLVGVKQRFCPTITIREKNND
jgi:hypothetical protein